MIPHHSPHLHPRIARPIPRRSAFSLIELTVSMGIMSVLLITISSALVIASKALPAANSTTTAQAQTTAALNQLAADLACATTITELTSTAITCTVPDRNHGAAGPETIRWAWSGTSGDPLTRSYNASAPTTIASRVSAFALAPTIIAGTLTSAPRVLMVVYNTASPSANDTARIAKLGAWGFPYTLMDSGVTQPEFDAACANADVLYIPTGTYSFTLGTRFANPALGIVNESDSFYSPIGVSTSFQLNSDNIFMLTDNSHEITSGLGLGNIPICTSASESLHATNGTLAPGARILGQTGGNPALIVIDTAALQCDNQPARARRVALPWGGMLINPFPFTDLKSDSRTILKRALVWAAAPSVYDHVSVSLTAGTAPAAAMKVELLNHPGVPRP